MAQGAAASVLAGFPSPMPSEGELGTEWRKWRKKFEIYLKATRQADDKTPSDVKTCLLLHAIGSEGRKIYEGFSFDNDENKDKYDVVLNKLKRSTPQR